MVRKEDLKEERKAWIKITELESGRKKRTPTLLYATIKKKNAERGRSPKNGRPKTGQICGGGGRKKRSRPVGYNLKKEHFTGLSPIGFRKMGRRRGSIRNKPKIAE